MLIRKMNNEDQMPVAAIHRLSFTRQLMSEEWARVHLAAFPKTLSFVAVADKRVAGYIFWSQKSGFRKEVVLELEQIAVHPGLRSKGVGRALIEQSLPLARAQLASVGATLKHIIVTTRADNDAQTLYRATLGAEVEAVINNLFSADEVIMIARGA